MAREFIRIWVNEDIDEISKHLIIMGESFSDCAQCKEAGLDIQSIEKCPQCGAEFRYVTARIPSGSSQRFHALRKVKERRPGLVFVDYEDYKRHIDRQRARDFLK